MPNLCTSHSDGSTWLFAALGKPQCLFGGLFVILSPDGQICSNRGSSTDEDTKMSDGFVNEKTFRLSSSSADNSPLEQLPRHMST